MNIKRAWAALWREPEPVEKTVEKTVEKFVPIGPDVRELYTANDKLTLERYRNGSSSVLIYARERPAWHGRTFWTCAEAFKDCGSNAEVSSRKIMFVDGEAYAFASLTKVDLPPKPKIAKGRAK